MSRQRIDLRRVAVLALAAGWIGCGTTPVTPTPTPVLPGPVTNSPPVITSLTSTAVPRMEIGQDVTFTADVADAEVPTSKLTLAWSANVGIMTGTGLTAVWHLTKGTVATPVDVTVTLTVIEKYDNVDAQRHAIVSENRVSKSTLPFRMHDSDAELSTMGVHFLVDLFGNSSVSPDACMVDFSVTCSGRNAELKDTIANRQDFFHFSAAASVNSITYDAPKPSALNATVALACQWNDRNLSTGKIGVTASTCFLTGVYIDRRWWLCASTIDHSGTCGACLTAGHSTMSLNEFARLKSGGGEAASPGPAPQVLVRPILR